MVQSETFRHNFWELDPEERVQCLFFMPNGVVIQMCIYKETMFREIKEDLWEEAERYPFFGHLKDKSLYVLNTVDPNENPISDESMLFEIKPMFCLFKVTERVVSVNNLLNKNISTLIGKTLSDFKTIKSAEVNDFRYKMNIMADEISHNRGKMSRLEKITYQFPPRLSKLEEMPETVRGRLRNDHFVIVTKFHSSQDASFTFNVPSNTTPHKLLEMILAKMELTKMTEKHKRPADYILKVCGQDEYLFGEHKLIQFLYIQDMLSRDAVPVLITKPVRSVEVIPETIYGVSELAKPNKPSTATLRKKAHLSSWDLDALYQIKILQIKGLNCDTNRPVEVGMQAGVFHGGKSLCRIMKTSEKMFSNDGICEWKEDLTFDISVSNMPRNVRLCIVVYETKTSRTQAIRARKLKDSNRDLYITPIAWVNTTIFDYKNSLKTGPVTLYTWNYTEDSQNDDLLNPLGTVEPNPRVDECATIIISFYNYKVEGNIQYPSEDSVINYAKTLDPNELNRETAHSDERKIADILQPYCTTMYYDRLNDMPEQERNAIWAKREECLHSEPNGLPSLLYCIEWNNRNEVAEMCRLLKEWPTLPVERSLELLDYAYADRSVRSFAVNCLRRIRDEELLLYLLQLVQAIKHESYLHCDLVEFLLERAFNNQRIGHFLFWHLRSEIQVPSVQQRFGLILEAYLMGSQEHILLLLKQAQCLEKLKTGSEIAKRGSKEKCRSSLQEYLRSRNVSDTLTDFINPLNPSFRCKMVKADKCKVMDSKMRPLWIVYENTDMHGDDINVIFKNGDDLRQDMLTLQMLRVMDRIWKENGHDFRMNTYSCVSMERRLGMIEVVLNAETIANIQKLKGMFSATSPFKKGSLLAWLKEHNTTEESLKKAIQEFTLSCAGYCVATYVLGVADRHSDNIMVKRTGQLFHIDFGHILGHFKEKFGFRRERVPFVLTHDFVYVINKGRTDKEAAEFTKFQELCETAFLILREHGCLILSLFAMMISTGLPELSSEKDLNYLRETLVLDLSKDEARNHFRSKFSEALANSWKTSLNWASHNFSKNNKQ